LTAYRRLRRANPAPYAAWITHRGSSLLSSSPERFVTVRPDGWMETRPIKGTTPRHTDPAADRAAALELTEDPKFRGENLMIVDLLRNDMSMVCEVGTVEVTELMLLVLIFAGLPLVSFSDEHAVMDFVDRLLGPRGRRALQRVVHVVSAAFMFLLTWLMWLKADRIWAYRDATDVLRILYGPFVYFMALALGLAGLIHLYKAVERG